MSKTRGCRSVRSVDACDSRTFRHCFWPRALLTLLAFRRETDLSYEESLVGSLAVILSIIAAVIAIGPWSQPYRLRTIAAVKARFGKPAARAVWLLIAVASLVAGLAILSGVRPPYAAPLQQSHAGR